MKLSDLETLVRARRQKRSVIARTHLDTGRTEVVDGTGAVADETMGEALRADRSQVVETRDGPVFLNVFNPPLRLLIVGAVHIAQPLSRMAQTAGFAVAIIDPREAFGNAARFQDLDLINAWPDEALGQLAIDARTAIVTLTHDPKLDDPALNEALKTPCFYIGALGSRKTHDARLARLQKMGWARTDLDRIHGPVGLAIGARSPAEIAVSILAQMIDVLRRSPDHIETTEK